MLLMSVILAGAISGSFGPAPGHEPFDGNMLYESCTATSRDKYYKEHAAACKAFVMGVTDTIAVLQSGEDGGPTICVPANATQEQLTDVVRNYMTNHAESRHLPAAGLSVVAIGQAFPCANSSSDDSGS